MKETQKEEERQRQLRQKHNVDDNVLVVEKTNIVKLLIGLIKTAASLLLILLCAMGLLSLIYPSIRIELMTVLENILCEVLSMVGL